MHYENNLRKIIDIKNYKKYCFTEKKKIGFQKAFFQKVHLEKGGGGRLIIRVNLYSGQYSTLSYPDGQCWPTINLFREL